MDGDTSRDFLNQCRATFVTAFHLPRGSTVSSPATAQAEMSHLHREIASLPQPSGLPVYRVAAESGGETDRRTGRGKRAAASSILSAKRPRTTSVALLRISQMRPWFSSGIPWRSRRRLSLVSRVICPSCLDSAPRHARRVETGRTPALSPSIREESPARRYSYYCRRCN